MTQLFKMHIKSNTNIFINFISTKQFLYSK